MSGISGSGRHVASHAKPGKINNAKGKVRTAAAVGSVLAVSGGVATGLHLHQDALRNSTESAAQDPNQAAAAGLLAARTTNPPAADRDLQRADLTTPPTTPSTAAPTTPPTTPPPSTPTPTSDTSSAAPTTHPTTSTTTRPSTSTTSKPTAPKTTTTPTTTSTTTSSTTDLGINATPAQAQAIAKQLVPSGQYACFANIINRESSWNIHATNPSSGAYGLPQALPGSKMAEYGSDWRNSATIQIKWALAYMTGRYGSPCAAWTFWQNHSWY
ncbi:hypothetical protein GCM10009839_79980 [Catenulispora yoronensis]|uniref:Transglycosylase SLT domain-containing protein n=1 Tax=Catenulispora yoronensis TaxID=450799 RepID=A0ABP5GYB5_9ACTN